MGAISLDEYKKRKQATQQEVARPNTILFSDYNAKYGNQKLPTEVTRAGNSFLLPTIEQPKVQKQEEQYIDTGKTYGDYWYQEYGKRKDDKIYLKDGKYYVLNSRTGEYDDVDRINYMTTEELDKKQLEEAKSLGYKGNKADLAKISNKILLDTGNLTKKEYADYVKELKKQEEKLNKEQAEKTKIRYSGTGIDALKQIGTKASDIDYSIKNEWKNSLNDGYDVGDITKTVIGTTRDAAPRVAKNTFEAGKEVVKHPIKSTKTLGVGIAAGVDKADDALNNALTDFSNWLLKKKKDNKPHLSLKEYNRLVETGTEEEKQQVLEQFKNAYGENSEEYKFYAKMFNIKDTRSKTKKTIYEIINPKYYKTETYKQFEKGELSEEQEKVWNVGTNIGNMLPSMVVSTVAAPIAGSAMFYVQSQQNYTEEAKARGYDDKKARIYGLIMGGVETGVERLGFDQLGGLGKLSEGNLFKAMGGEALEEFATPYIDFIVRNRLGENYKLSDAVEESITGAVYGAVVGGIMNMGGKGIVTVDKVVNKINNNQQITSQEMTQAINDIKKQDPNYFEEIMQEVPEVIKSNINDNTKTTTIENISNENNTNLTSEENFTVQQLVKDDLNGKNITIIDDTNTQTKEQIQNRIASLKEDLQTYETFTNEATRTESETREINNIKQEIKNLQQELKQQNNIPTVQDLVNQQKNQQVTKTNNLNEYIADVAAREAIQNENNRQSVRESILSYLDENKITNPTKEDMMNAMDWYEGFDASENLAEINKAEKLYSEVADELLSEKNNTLTTQNNQEIQGMKATKSQVEDAVYSKFDQMSSEYGFDVDEVEGVYLHGSRLRGTATQNSDIDAVVFYIGNESEDFIFNTINNENNQLVIDGIKVDINPISIDSLSEIDDYIAKSEAYDNQIINSTKNQTVNEVKLKDSNIPINQELLNKYNNATDMMNAELNNYDGKIEIKSDIAELNDIKIESLNTPQIYHLASEIFNKYHNTNEFFNNGKKITVSNGDIKESINKITHNPNQKKFIREHMQVFSDLGDTIEHATLAGQNFETKNRSNNQIWSYYLNGLKINGEEYLFEFDVISRDNGENHYRIQRLQKKADTSAGNVANSNITPTLEASAYDNNIPQINEKVKLLPTNNDMQNFENNAKKITNKEKNFQSLEATAPIAEQEQIAPVKKITTDPTKESSYDDADLPNFWELNKKKKSNLDNEIDEFKRAVDRQLQEETTTPKQIKRNNTLKSQFETMWSDFQEKFVNRNYEIDKYSKKTGNKEIMFKGDMLNNVAGEVTGDINIGQTDNYGKQIGESLNSLFKNAKKKGYYDQFDDYLKHYSNIDRHGYGKGSVVPLEYSQKMIKAYEKSIPGIKNEATKVWQYGKNMLSNMEENGLISKDFKATLEDMYPHYVPYMQSDSMVPYMDDSGEIKPKKVIKRAEGKAHDLITVEEALEKYTYAHKKAIRQNDLYKEIVKTSKEKISIGADDRVDPTQLNNSLGHDMEGNGFLTAYVDGNMQQAQISDALYQELAKTNELRLKDAESKYAPILKPLQKVSEIRRNILTTWNPFFLIKNSIKDIQDGALNSKYTKDMVKNYPGAFYELATQSTDTARQFSSLYGSGMVMGEYQVDRLTNSTKNLDIKQLNKVMQAIPNLNEIIELTPRYAEFKASLEHGTSVTEAMYNARELTTNFGRGGYITKALNRNGFTFLNASVQGFDKMIRNFTGANGSKGIAVSVTGTLMKVVALGVAPALFNATAFGAGDDDEDEAYKALPNYIKDNYYLFKVKGLGNKTSKYYDGTFLRIPKGRVLSVFGSAARRTLEFTKGDKNAFDGFLKNVDSQIGINNPEENNIFAPIKQAFGSKNGEAWYGGDIIPKRLQNKPAAEQYDESTDEFSKWLGKTLNISPYKINYLVDQYSGGVGDIVLPMITKETTNGATTVPDYLLAPLKDKYIVNSTDDNKYASNFYSSLEKVQTKANGEKSKVEDKLKYKYMSSISSDMSKLYKEKREIQLDDSLTKKQKYKKVQNVQKEINRLAEEGIKDYKVKDLKSNYGKIANKEYYKNNKNEWSVIKDEESADLNSMRMTSNEKNNYFIAKNKISNIKQQDIDSKIKKSKISDIVLKTNLSDEKMAYLYGKYYSKEETLDIIQDAGISIKEFIKFDSQDIESDYYANGKAVPNSKKKKTIAYINSLNLSAIQKAMLIRMEYSSFTSYDRQIIQYVNNQKLNSEDKKAIYEKLGFKIRNGRVYSK